MPVEPVSIDAPPPPSGKTKRAPKPKRWSLKALKIRPSQSRLADMINELEQIPTERANVHAVMLRIYVELATDDYIRRRKLTVAGSKGGEPTLRQKVNAAADDLRQRSLLDGKQVAAVNRATANERFLSTKTLQQYVHNEHLHPSPTDVETLWKNFGSYLVALA